ncbi:hypothetical protein C8J42_11613 [Sphingomonas sp. PP-CE-1A-559]|uniref:hypothetical protein n=1 Tax=Sphingomonas sp. PP-CE-1A-559 TaxID=2135657 RepID=UPI0010E95671|nr:hypothetical protein [Sphingomonas sp. PP-CE-1A-559]TCP84421.1 hypothetical protein C8J42_11613 [Sphingomonas sp. PP-CE-1A-559]
MKLENWVRVRLNESQMLVYAAEAEARGIPISTYLRDRLASADLMREELASIRAAMIDMGETMDELRDQVAERLVAPTQDTGEPSAIEIETLLLLRVLSGSQNRQMVTAEIERQGLKPFRIPGPPTRSR